jgi:hypothetical protein
MIRLIFKRDELCTMSGLQETTFETVDIDCLSIEMRLTRTGNFQSGFDCTQLVGVEVIEGSSI